MKLCRGKRYGEQGRRRVFWLGPAVVLLALAWWGCSAAIALDIPTGSDDWLLRFDNTVRYTLLSRLMKQEGGLIGDINSDDGDRNFTRRNAGIVNNRFDLFTEADLIYKREWGFHFSGASWYDQTYNDGFDNTGLRTGYNQINKFGQQAVILSPFANRYFAGPSGELLDAMVFGRLDVCNVPIHFKVGRHAVVWGEPLLDPFNAISYGQGPLDLGKATQTPGIEVKELFRPDNQVSAVAQLTPEFTVAVQSSLQWDRDYVPEDGTFFSATDLNLRGDGILILGPGLFLRHGPDILPNEFKDFGVSARWSPKFLNNGTIGFYFRNFSDRLPQPILDFGDRVGVLPAGVQAGTYRFAYAGDIQTFGLSYAGVLYEGSLGSELSFRHDMPLRSTPAIISSNASLPGEGETLGARGDTVHFLVNYLHLMKKNCLWDAGSYIIEFDTSAWTGVTQNGTFGSVFKGDSSYTAMDRATDTCGVLHANFAPQWLQVCPGVDLTVPFSVTWGMWGTAAETNNGAKDEGSWGVGLAFDIWTKYKVNIDYVSFFGAIEVDPLTGAVNNRAGNGAGTAGLRDRDFIAVTLKTTF